MNKLTTSLAHLYQNKELLVLGLGKEGISTLEQLKQLFPGKILNVMDQAETLQLSEVDQENVNLILGKSEYLLGLERYDVIFKTPSIPLTEPQLQEFIKHDGIITSQLNEFLRVYRNQTVGITGTKGKSTTTTFIYQLLLAANKVALLAGNIGIPPFEIVSQITDETVVAMEMSSYQLQAVTFSPHWAILLNIFSEHLNYHGTIDEYVLAKANILKFQGESDYSIYNENEPLIKKFATQSKGIKKPFQPYAGRDEIALLENVQTSLSDVFLTQDLPAALQFAEVTSIDNASVVQTIQTFQPLSHRLEPITTKSGVTFIDDTLATIPEAAIAAIQAYPQAKVVMLGGFDRGIEYSLIVEEVVKKKIPVVIFFKPSGEKMKQLIEATYSPDQFPEMHLVDTMEQAVRISFEKTKRGDVVLLSPASPSFGQFHDYQDKAAQFRHWIQELDQP